MKSWPVWIATARNAGILWAQSAGNQARRHWSGAWRDTDANNYHEFNLGPWDEGQTISLSAGQSIDVYLTWNDTWGASGNNYDLLLFNSTNVMVASSTDIQNGNDSPDEELSYTATVPGDYYLAIRKTAATGTPFFRLLSYTHEFQYQVAAGSLMEPADSINSLAVGAVPWSSPTTLETFSSQGPTTDGRVKPDLVAPDGVSSVAYGHSFYGTSASAPHVAGAALLVKQRYAAYTPAQIQSFFENNAVDLGAGGKDNLYGSGRLSLPALQPVEVYFKLDTDTAAGNQGHHLAPPDQVNRPVYPLHLSPHSSGNHFFLGEKRLNQVNIGPVTDNYLTLGDGLPRPEGHLFRVAGPDANNEELAARLAVPE